MLRKLLKYDLRYIYKVLGVYYVVALACVTLGSVILAFKPETFWIEFLGQFLRNAGIGLGIGLLINAFTRTWARLNNDFYGAAGYLTNTLPVSRALLYASKALSSLITLALSYLVCLLGALIIVALNGEIDWAVVLESIFVGYAGNSLLSPFTLGLAALITVFFEAALMLQSGFVGIIASHRFNAHRKLIGTAIGIATYLLCGALVALFTFIWTKCDPAFAQFLNLGVLYHPATLVNFLIGIGIFYLAANVALYFINLRVLKPGVNVN